MILQSREEDRHKDFHRGKCGTQQMRVVHSRCVTDEMVGWHHRLNGQESEQTQGDSDGQGSLACCSPWGCKESDMTKQLN